MASAVAARSLPPPGCRTAGVPNAPAGPGERRALDRIEVDAGRQSRFELTLANSCPELTSAYSVRFVSQMFGEGSICGNSGDAVEILAGGTPSLLAQRWGARLRDDAGPSGLGPAPWQPPMTGSRCAIAAVSRVEE